MTETTREMPGEWLSLLWSLRVSAPVMCLTALALLCFSISTHHPLFADVQGVCAVANAYLAYIEWFVFTPEWPGRKLPCP